MTIFKWKRTPFELTCELAYRAWQVLIVTSIVLLVMGYHTGGLLVVSLFGCYVTVVALCIYYSADIKRTYYR